MKTKSRTEVNSVYGETTKISLTIQVLKIARFIFLHIVVFFSSALCSAVLLVQSLSSVSFSDNHFGQNFAKMVFSTLLDTASGISVLDLSENNISDWLSHFRWRSSSCSQSPSGIGKSLQSLSVLNLRSLIPYFVEMSERDSHFADLKVENCELSCNGVSQLVGVLSTLKRPLDSLSIGENGLGNKVGAPLGNFLGIGIQALEIEDIGLGSSGFLELQKEIGEDLKLAYINMRFY
ncbi:hypothetical protein ACSBR1_042386 [Camellia fascicularis]